MSENIALEKKRQSKFARKAKKLQQKAQPPKESGETSSSKQKQEVKYEKGIIYLGHIPHGFYEEEIKNYFKQFGKVNNVIVCRSKKTNKSKGYGFIQFHNPEVAKVAAETMNNYLMFKRKLIAQYIPPEQVKPHMQKPSFWQTSSYKKLSMKKKEQIRKKNTNIPDTASYIAKSNLKFEKKKKQLEALGIKYDFKPVIEVNGESKTTITSKNIIKINKK